MKNKAAVFLGLAVAAILLPSLLSPRHKSVTNPPAAPEGTIRCALDLGAYEDSTHGLINGYNYYLLQKFAWENGITAEIVVAERGDSWLDSLADGSVDAVVLPLHQHSGKESVLYTIPVDNLTTWAVSPDKFNLLQAFDKWLDNYHNSEEFARVHRSFIRVVGNPLRLAENGVQRSSLSPYDSLFRKYAATLDWDWRLLAAVVFQESRFHLEVRSPRGARGLMQLMQSTAEAHIEGDILDPEQNIAAGTRYLKRLIGIFSSRFDNPDEILRHTLAAYNVGEGNVLDYMEADGDTETEGGKWPEEYIQNVMELYRAFCEICP